MQFKGFDLPLNLFLDILDLLVAFSVGFDLDLIQILGSGSHSRMAAVSLVPFFKFNPRIF